ncbi:MAG: PepSY-associated TM helix domain-containing protein [Methylomonas lenta]|nr:PepSY-associated TM helix domain-containing protein [Methylomonas lenta]
MMKIRPFWVLLHRYVGLAMTAFLIVVGLTGCLLAFYAELDAAINPQWSTSTEDRTPLGPLTLLESAERFDPTIKADAMWLSETAATVTVSPRMVRNDESPEPAYDQLILNPYTGELLGQRHWGDLSQGLQNLMPFIYKLHYALALGDIGVWILGITALVWTLDCFVGFYLTLPPGKAHRPGEKSLASKSFWQRWQPAWQIKCSASKTRINFDCHRAGGLWLWLALLVFAWSSVYMNLGGFYSKVMQSVSEYHQPWSEFPDLPQPVQHPQIGWRQAQDIVQVELNRLEQQQGIKIELPSGFWINRAKGFYVYAVKSSADIQDHGGQTRVVIDAKSGSVKQVLLPTGQYSGNTITSWLLALHTANIWGLPYRIFVCVLGLAIVMLSVTGVLIWLKKRRRFSVQFQAEPKHRSK